MNPSPTKYQKLPVVIEAMQWDGTTEGATPIIQWILDAGGTARWHEAREPRLHDEWCRCDGRGIVPGPYVDGKPVTTPCPETAPVTWEGPNPRVPAHIAIDTREGTMKALGGDWVIREPNPTEDRKFYPCKADIFASTYRAAGEVAAALELLHQWGIDEGPWDTPGGELYNSYGPMPDVLRALLP